MEAQCPSCRCNVILELRLCPVPPPAVQLLVPTQETLHAPQDQEQAQQPQQQPQQLLSEAFSEIGKGLQCEKQKEFKTAVAYYKSGTAKAIQQLKQWSKHDPNLPMYAERVRIAIARSERVMDAMKAIAEQLADSPLRQAAQPQHEEQPQQLQRQPEAAAATGATAPAAAAAAGGCTEAAPGEQPQQPQRQPEAAHRPHQEQQPQQPQRQPEAAQQPHLEQQPQQPQRQPEAAQRLQLQHPLRGRCGCCSWCGASVQPVAAAAAAGAAAAGAGSVQPPAAAAAAGAAAAGAASVQPTAAAAAAGAAAPGAAHQGPQPQPLQPTKRIPKQPSTAPPSKLMRTVCQRPERPELEAIVKESCKQEATEDEWHH